MSAVTKQHTPVAAINESAAVPPGYKRTEVGVIPEDWSVKPFGRLFTFTNGVNADKTAYGKGLRFINVLEPITYSHIYGPEIQGRVEVSGSVATAYSVRHGDIVFNRTSETDAELGLAAVYVGDEQVVFGGFVICGRPIDDALDSQYSGYALRAKMIRSQIIPMGQGAVRANIGQQNLRRVLAAIPPKLEQRAIAEALSDVDGLLGALEALIAKKQAIKQAAMQQLLTGKTRLPGFNGKWEMKRLGEIADIKNGATPSTQIASYWDGTIPWCTPTDITSTPGKYLENTERRITEAGLTSCAASLLPAGSLLLCSRATIGEVKIAQTEICTNQGFKSLVRRKGISNEFLYYLILTLKPQMLERAIGSTFLEIGKRDISTIATSLPAEDEQTAIARVLSDMDAEIAALETRRNKTRAIKQGMMQQLLTGRVRLVKPEVAA